MTRGLLPPARPLNPPNSLPLLRLSLSGLPSLLLSASKIPAQSFAFFQPESIFCFFPRAFQVQLWEVAPLPPRSHGHVTALCQPCERLRCAHPCLCWVCGPEIRILGFKNADVNSGSEWGFWPQDGALTPAGGATAAAASWPGEDTKDKLCCVHQRQKAGPGYTHIFDK